MNWLPDWVRVWLRAASAPARPPSRRACLALEVLEDRVVPTSTSTDAAFRTWAHQRFRVDDVRLARPAMAPEASAATTATNNSFGALIGLDTVFSTTAYRGAGYSVAVIDTGINYNDPELGGGWGNRVVDGYNFVANNTDPMDDNGHGTFVASEIGSSSTTYSGVAPDVNLIALKVLDANGAGTYGNVLRALDWVVEHRAQYNIVAINLSLGSGNYTINPYTYLEPDFAALKSEGVLIAVAAGNGYYSNNSQAGLAFPATSPNVVSVGAVWDGSFGSVAWGSGARDYNTAADQITSFSQRGPALSILAPGAIVTADALKGGYTTMGGTSMATPVIAGVAVLLHEALVDDGMGAQANQDYIVHLMQSTGKTIVDADNGTDNVKHTGLAFKRVDLASAIAAITDDTDPPPAPQPPTLAGIADQAMTAGASLTIPLDASDPNGLPLTYSVSVPSVGSQAYQLKTSLGLQFSGSYNTNLMGGSEKWLTSKGGQWYCLLPSGELRRWAGTWSATLEADALVASLGSSFYADPSKLWNASAGAGAAPATASIAGGVLTLDASAGYQGSFPVQVTVSNGMQSATQSFTVTVTGSAAGITLAPVADQTVKAGQALKVRLGGSDPTGRPLTYSTQLAASDSLPYRLKTSLGLEFSGSYNANLNGANEKWLTSSSGEWYCLLPSGELRLWKGSWDLTLAADALVASLGSMYYTQPKLLWNAQPTTMPLTLSVANGVVQIQPNPSFRGTLTIKVAVSNGITTATQTFTVTVTA